MSAPGFITSGSSGGVLGSLWSVGKKKKFIFILYFCIFSNFLYVCIVLFIFCFFFFNVFFATFMIFVVIFFLITCKGSSRAPPIQSCRPRPERPTQPASMQDTFETKTPKIRQKTNLQFVQICPVFRQKK